LSSKTGGMGVGVAVGVPRVELTHTPPIVWELDQGEKMAEKARGDHRSQEKDKVADGTGAGRDSTKAGRPSTSS
jgi:hypothetical protein